MSPLTSLSRASPFKDQFGSTPYAPPLETIRAQFVSVIELIPIFLR